MVGNRSFYSHKLKSGASLSDAVKCHFQDTEYFQVLQLNSINSFAHFPLVCTKSNVFNYFYLTQMIFLDIYHLFAHSYGGSNNATWAQLIIYHNLFSPSTSNRTEYLLPRSAIWNKRSGLSSRWYGLASDRVGPLRPPI